MGLLRPHPGVSHLCRFDRAALAPAGDVIEAVVARGLVQDVLDALVSLGVDRHGEITVQSVDVMLSRTVDDAASAIPADGGDPVVWDELVETTGEEAQLTATFLAFLTIGCLLAAVGVVTDSAVLIVGAMVVSPDFGPLAALCVAAVGRRADLAVRAAKALGVGFPAAILATAFLAWIAEQADILSDQSLTDLGSIAFVYQVGPYSFIVALLAGTAGMLALTSQKSGALVGVFISITTVPAAGFAALAAVLGEWPQCGEALLQLLINLSGVVIAGTLTLWLRRHRIPSKAGRMLR